MNAARPRRALAVLTASASIFGLTTLAAPPAQAATCTWVVTWQTAGVYNDAYMSVHLKNKYLDEKVGPYCSEYKFWNGSYWMTPVSCACDHYDGVGWMRSAALNPA